MAQGNDDGGQRRAVIKRALVALLDGIAEEHPLGHQAGYAARYILTTYSGASLEIMIEKGRRSPANVWVLEVAGNELVSKVPAKLSPKTKLRTKIGSNGEPTYGRHSALEKLPQLGDADLLCFAPETLSDVGAILDCLLAIRASDLR